MQKKHRDWVQDEKLKEEEAENKFEGMTEEASETEEKSAAVETEDDNAEASIEEDTLKFIQSKFLELQVTNSKLTEESVKLQNEVEALKEKLIRLSAEYENHRKRTLKEKEAIYNDACEDVLQNMFPVLDNLERAVSVGGTVEDIKVGIDMTIRQFKTGLEKVLVEEISTENGFDPNLHNAVMHIEDPELGANSIAEVFQKGYRRGDKVIRFSMVKVAN